jgi:site-specific DNA recombinase
VGRSTALFEAVQQKLSAHQSHETLTREKSDHLLKDLLFDNGGHRMITTHATKASALSLYVSQPGLHGEVRTAKLGSISRIPAPEIEQAIISALQEYLADNKLGKRLDERPFKLDRATLGTFVSRIEVQRDQLVISLKPTNGSAEPTVLWT